MHKKIKINENGCWVWTGEITYQGYGKIYINGKNRNAHRYFYEQVKGKIPEGLTIDHLCRNKACVNPEHLEAVTLLENIRRSLKYKKPRVKNPNCPKGHPFDENNLYFYRNKNGRGKRLCRKCRAINQDNYRKRLAMGITGSWYNEG